jgi:hypothetical protein
MAILEEQVLEENTGKTEEELDELVEVKEAEDAQVLMRDAWGGGLDHQTLMRYDQMAHHLSHQCEERKLGEAEHLIALHWDPLHKQYKDEDWTALAAVESIKAHVLTPVMQRKTEKAREQLEWKASDLMQTVAQGDMTRDEVKDHFLGEVSMDVTGVKAHQVAIEVYEQLLAPVAAAPAQEEVQIEQPKMEEKAEEEIQEEEQKQSA